MRIPLVLVLLASPVMAQASMSWPPNEDGQVEICDEGCQMVDAADYLRDMDAQARASGFETMSEFMLRMGAEPVYPLVVPVPREKPTE